MMRSPHASVAAIRREIEARTAGAWKHEGGAAAVEFALIGLPLFLLIFGIVEGGRMLWTQNSLQYSVEQAARCAVVNASTCGTTTQIQSYAVSKAYGLNLSASVFTVSNPSCGTKVSASLPYQTILPVSINVTLTASSCRPS
jgi:Flp pilus assembly protein TadG